MHHTPLRSYTLTFSDSQTHRPHTPTWPSSPLTVSPCAGPAGRAALSLGCLFLARGNIYTLSYPCTFTPSLALSLPYTLSHPDTLSHDLILSQFHPLTITLQGGCDRGSSGCAAQGEGPRSSRAHLIRRSFPRLFSPAPHPRSRSFAIPHVIIQQRMLGHQMINMMCSHRRLCGR